MAAAATTPWCDMTRNQSRFIPGESLGQVSDWTFAAVDQHTDRFAAKLRAQEAQEALERDTLLREAGYADGFSEGFAQGHAQGQMEGQQNLDTYVATRGAEAAAQFAELFDSAKNQLAAQEQAIAAGVLDMALLLARQVLRQELSVNPNALMPVLREALGLLVVDNRPSVVRLNPVDLDVFSDAIRESFPGLALTLLPDAAVTQGGCLVECAGTVVDATLETRWKKAIASIGLQADWEGGDASD